MCNKNRMENYSHHHDNGNVVNRTSMDIDLFNRIQAIRDSEVRATVFFTSKIHALNTLKMPPLLRSDVMQS
jgi:hypothetical protein